MSIGLLGMPALQLTGMRENAGALRHSQASWLAYDMADRMRANLDHSPATAAGDRANHYDGIAVSSDNVPAGASCGENDTCNFTSMAGFDALQWWDRIALLPGGAGSVTKLDATGRYAIRVMWDEADTDNNPKGCPSDTEGAETDKTCVEITLQP